MEIISQIPALLRVFIVFGLILVAIRFRLSLGTAFFLGAVVLGTVFAVPPGVMARSMITSVVAPKTFALSLIVSLILVLSQSMEMTGQMGRMLRQFQGVITSPRLNLLIFPALIGLLPMPGGAVFSAPMVKNAGGRFELSPAQLSYVNYWFRHIWEYWWPLYPSVLIIPALAHIDLWKFMAFACPLTVVVTMAGYVPLRRLREVTVEPRDRSTDGRSMGSFVREITPIAMVIVLGLVLGAFLAVILPPESPLAGIEKETGLIVALVLAIGWVWRCNRLSRKECLDIVLSPHVLRMVMMVVAILAFKGMLEDSGAIEDISRDLLRWGIPLVSVAVLLPFIVGGVVGLTLAFVGTTFPILIGLIHAGGHESALLGYLMMGFASGFAGVLMSPLHLCLLLTNQYFGTTLSTLYRYLWIPCGVLVLSSVIYFWLFRWIVVS